MWDNRNPHSLLVGVQNDNLAEDKLVVSYKTKRTLIQSSSYNPWYLSKEAENLYSPKNLHMDVYSSFIHNCQNLEATKMFSNR